MKRQSIILGGLLVATTLTLNAFYGRGGEAAPAITAEAVTRGSIVTTVAATGTLEAVTTVQVGSQVSGTVEALYADFNSIVKEGQVLARLDPSLYNSAIEQAEANLVKAQADHDRIRVSLVDAESKLARATELAARELIAANELETAKVARDSIEAQLRSADASVSQARASLEQARVNLAKTVITSPIDGIVISRNVDVGQTVAASLSAPVLYLIAADLSQMQLNASIDESDLGQLADGQPVQFTVDAYPTDSFHGVVKQVRLNPVVASNVVTYSAIITAPNPDPKLKPGMTANLTIEVARRDDVLRAPAAALRFRPTADVLAALGATGAGASPGATLWTATAEAVVPVPVKTGISDGTWTEILEGAIEAGAPVVTRVTLDASGSADASPSASGNPLMGSQPGGPGGRGR